MNYKSATDISLDISLYLQFNEWLFDKYFVQWKFVIELSDKILIYSAAQIFTQRFCIDFIHTCLLRGIFGRKSNEFVRYGAKNVYIKWEKATYQYWRTESKQIRPVERRKCLINNTVESIGVA